MFTEVLQLAKVEDVKNWIKSKVLEGKDLYQITQDQDFIDLKKRIKTWREDPESNQYIPENYVLESQVSSLYDHELRPFRCIVGPLNLDYFINKFEKIPYEHWCIGETCMPDGVTKDVLGHCGQPPGQVEIVAPEALHLWELTKNYVNSLVAINDGNIDLTAKIVIVGNNPKDRIIFILKALRYEMMERIKADLKAEQDAIDNPPETDV